LANIPRDTGQFGAEEKREKKPAKRGEGILALFFHLLSSLYKKTRRGGWGSEKKKKGDERDPRVTVNPFSIVDYRLCFHPPGTNSWGDQKRNSPRKKKKEGGDWEGGGVE